MMQKFLVQTLLIVTGCAAGAPSLPATTPEPAVRAPSCALGDSGAALGPASRRPASELVAKLGSGVDSYHLQDGVWLAHAPVMVNEPFDFAQAMGLGAIGAGLAAATRQKNNQARAEQLAARELEPEVAARVDALRACGIHRWVLAWGTGESAETHVLTERYDANGVRIETREKVLPGDLAFDSSTWLAPADDGAPVRAHDQAAEPPPVPQ
jgi:hypothetical protein